MSATSIHYVLDGVPDTEWEKERIWRSIWKIISWEWLRERDGGQMSAALFITITYLEAAISSTQNWFVLMHVSACFRFLALMYLYLFESVFVFCFYFMAQIKGGSWLRSRGVCWCISSANQLTSQTMSASALMIKYVDDSLVLNKRSRQEVYLLVIALYHFRNSLP